MNEPGNGTPVVDGTLRNGATWMISSVGSTLSGYHDM